jgi:hypothetical protein
MPTLNIRQINGVVRTSEPVWSNLERLAEAASVWFTYDTHNGVYSWVINEAGSTVASITEADIIGPIQISGSGLNNLYNSAEMEYPRSDLNDQPHYVTVNLPDDLRNQYEPDNKLQITSEFINNQPQAEYVAMVTLKQSRLDRTVTIVMDYSKINLQAGDIIDITSDTYGWTAKEFRIMRVREIEGDDGSLRLEFSCTEYDDTIYDGTWDNFLVGGAPGIRAIGAIGQPATPTITLTTVNSLPAQTVTTTVPEGVVDRVQFWAGNVLITGNVANTDFNLVGSVASTDAASFTQGANVVFNTTSLTDGTWIWKSRGTNGGGTGPFSTVSANVAYARNQAPDVIIVGTPTVDSTGNALTSGGSMLSVLFDTEYYPTIAQAVSNTSATILGNASSRIFTAPFTGDYRVEAIFDTNSAGAFGGRGSVWGETEDILSAGMTLYTHPGNVAVTQSGSGGVGSFGWTDHHLMSIATLTAGQDYKLALSYLNYTQSSPTATANVTVHYNVYTSK